jgi:toxin secretion/phage lysis holin
MRGFFVDFFLMMTQLANLAPQADRVLMAIGGALGAAYSFLFGGGVGVMLIWLICFVAADFLTGCWSACKRGEWRSRTCANGIARKVLVFVMVAFAHGADVAFSSLIDMQVIESIVICAYVLSEFGSIIENLETGGLGHVVPSSVRKLLAILNQRVDRKIEELDK